MQIDLPMNLLETSDLVEMAKRRREDRIFAHIEVPEVLVRDLPLIRDLESIIQHGEVSPYANT